MNVIIPAEAKRWYALWVQVRNREIVSCTFLSGKMLFLGC